MHGIRKAAINNPNLNDFAQWTVFDGGYWNGIVNFDNQLIALNTNNRVYKYNGFFFGEFGIIGETGLDIRATADYLIVTSANHVFIYNTSLGQIVHIQTSQVTAAAVTFSCATIINENIYIGTTENGVLASSISAPTNFEFIMPNGPSKNNMFAINAASSNLWAVYGGYDITYNPDSYIGYTPTTFGISKYNETAGWLNIPYSEVLGAKALSKISVNPNDETQVYISSYNSGLLKLENDVPTILLDNSNSPLEPTLDGPSIRINGTVFDRQGNLWVTNSKVNKELKVLKSGGQWQSFDMASILDSPVSSNLNKIVVDKSGTK